MCFNHILGLPRKDGIEKSIFDYEKLLYDSLLIPEINNPSKHIFKHKHLWVKKATGLGVTDRTEKKGYETTIDYYEAARIAYTESEYMRKHFDSPKGINNLNKDNKVLWEFTYRILNEEKERVKVVNKDPDNLLVQWVPGGKTITEIFKEMNKGCRSILYT